MAVAITRQDKSGKGERWMLDIGGDLVTLTTPAGVVLLRWSPPDVANAVQFPSFSKSIKYTGFNVAGQGMYAFDIDPATLKQLRQFANRGIAGQGPEAIKSVLRNAILTSLGGFALMCFGLVALTVTILEASGKMESGGRHPLGFISTLVGLAILCRGLYGFRQYSQLKQLTDEKTPHHNGVR